MKTSSKHFSDFFEVADAPREHEEDRDFAALRGLKRSLLAELSGADGPPVRPEEILERWPGDARTDRDAASVLFEDFQQRARSGEEPSREEYAERFPEYKDSLAALFHRQDVLKSFSAGSSSSVPTLSLPVIGDELFGFRLRHKLGSGAFARVYLAEQANLADRPVVLKVSDTDGDEPRTLAQMQHTNIVPIYSVHEDEHAGLRAVCMPYFGGASLSRLLEEIWSNGVPPGRGRQLVEALAAASGPRTATLPEQESADHGLLAVLSHLDYVRASVWMIAHLAEGLQHAHQRGVLHRDIKPSNILVGADGQPMLLDFNLSHQVEGERACASATLGGTIAYMAPEHLRALAARDPALTRLVDQRSDIYSLGMVFYEMLAGQSPFQSSISRTLMPVDIAKLALERAEDAPSLRAQGGDVPWGVESILRRCLAPEPKDRYQNAAALAEDLRRFLNDLPLRHAPELSQVERLQKWLRRHPRFTSAGSIATAALVLLFLTGAALVGVRSHLDQTREQLDVTQGRQRKQAFEKLRTEAFCFVNTTSDLPNHREKGLSKLREVLGLYAVVDSASWQHDSHWQRLSATEQGHLAEDIRELLMLLAFATVQAGPKDFAAARGALTLLERAEAVDGLPPSPALFRDRANYLRLLGDEEQARASEAQADRLQPVTARDHYLLATSYIRAGGPEAFPRALVALNHAVALRPSQPDYWTHMQRGICHLELRNYYLAASDFGTCIGIWPEFAWGHFNQGLALDEAKRKEEALPSYTAALGLDPSFRHAWQNRGVLLLELGRPEDALHDLRQAASLGWQEAALHLAMGSALEQLERGVEADSAFEKMFARLPTVPAERARYLCDYGFRVVKRLPRAAALAFEEVLLTDPRHVQALYGMGIVAIETRREPEAIVHFSKALEVQPEFLEARSCRAVLYARSRRFEQAEQEINDCVRKNPRLATSWYDRACVLALAAAAPGYAGEANLLKKRALESLKEAFLSGFGAMKAAGDVDLVSLRDHPAFHELLRSAKDRRLHRKTP